MIARLWEFRCGKKWKQLGITLQASSFLPLGQTLPLQNKDSASRLQNFHTWKNSKYQEMKGSIQVFNLMLQKVLLFAVKRDLNLQPWSMHECGYSCVFRESQALKLTGPMGSPRHEITITEPEALQVLQLINFLQLQARGEGVWGGMYCHRLTDPWIA